MTDGPRMSGAAWRALRRRRERVEAVLGFLGFFIVVTTVAAIVAIVRGEPSVWASVLLIGLLALFAWAMRVHRRLNG